MKNIEFYCHKTYRDNDFKQIALTPALYYVHYTYAKFRVIRISFLFWNFGIRIYKK